MTADLEGCEHEWNDTIVFDEPSFVAMCDICGCVIDDKGVIRR